MQKKKPYGDTLKEQLRAGARDRLFNFILADGSIRGAIMNGTRMVNEMRANHELGILETLVLGRAYLGAGLMSADLKSNDRISIKIDCSGPVAVFWGRFCLGNKIPGGRQATIYRAGDDRTR
jgi:molecular chaperone Hsp33